MALKLYDFVKVHSRRLGLSGVQGKITEVIETPEFPILYRVRIWSRISTHGNYLIVYAKREELRGDKGP